MSKRTRSESECVESGRQAGYKKFPRSSVWGKNDEGRSLDRGLQTINSRCGRNLRLRHLHAQDALFTYGRLRSSVACDRPVEIEHAIVPQHSVCRPPHTRNLPQRLNSIPTASMSSQDPLSESQTTFPSDSENYDANHSNQDSSDEPPSDSSSPMILYSPPTFWSILRGAAINLLLPFVNGLMLGFGELFAHEAAFRLGWSKTKVCLNVV